MQQHDHSSSDYHSWEKIQTLRHSCYLEQLRSLGFWSTWFLQEEENAAISTRHPVLKLRRCDEEEEQEVVEV